MAVENPGGSGPSMMDVAIKVIQATLATLAAYRAARSALKAWQDIIGNLRGGSDEAEDAPA